MLDNRTKKIMEELSKINNNEDNLNIILKKVISNEKLVFPRLKIFEAICPIDNY